MNVHDAMMTVDRWARIADRLREERADLNRAAGEAFRSQDIDIEDYGGGPRNGLANPRFRLMRGKWTTVMHPGAGSYSDLEASTFAGLVELMVPLMGPLVEAAEADMQKLRDIVKAGGL